jgi:enoyl-CoA hydratase/carnithine racemase
MNAAVLDIPPTDKVKSKKENGVGWLIFDNPERRNAISIDMSYAAGQILEDYASDPAVRVVILRGGGDKAFISGGDISKFEKMRATPESREMFEKVKSDTRQRLYTIEKPTIAMIHGYCLGGGLAYALNCDIRICADDARFGIPAAKLSIGYGAKGIRQLMDLVGPSMAKEILYTAKQYTAEEALRMGLVNRVIPKAELDNYVQEYAEVIANNAPLAILNAKTAVNELVKDPADRNMKLVAERAHAATSSQDHIEGRNAFLQKRKPVFTGK